MFDKLKLYLESIHITPISWLVGVSGVLIVRFFLESLSSPTSSGFFSSDASTLIHYYLFFLTVAVMLMIFIQKFVPSWQNVTPQFISIAMIAVFIAPFFDWIINNGSVVTMAYLFDSPKEMIASFLTFFGKNCNIGITLGLRIEIIFILSSIGLLVYFVSKSLRRVIFSFISLYVLIFIFLSFPGIINIIGGQNNPLFFIQKSIENSATISNNIHSSLQYSSAVRLFEVAFNFMMGKILFLILILASSIWFYLNFKDKFKAVIKNSRPERVAHYFLMVFSGLFIAHVIFPAVKFNWNDWLSVIVLCFSFYFSWMFAVCVNDIVDEDIDAVSNINRPLIKKFLNKEDLKQSAFLFLVASLLAGFLAGYTAFFFVLIFTAFYYIYSAPPTRFKLISFFSSFIIGLCALTAVLAGFFLLSPLKQVSTFPTKLAWVIVVVFFLGSHIRDIKDIEGDKKAGVKTVPVIFGDVWGARVVGYLSSLAFILVPVLLSSYIIFATAVPAALANYYFVTKKPFVEKYIFYVYFVFVFLSFLLLFL